MLATPHILTGAVIGVLLVSLPAVIVVAFLSHFVLDAIPHTEVSTFRPIEERDIDDPKIDEITYRLAFVDLAIGLSILTIIITLKGYSNLILVGAGAAILLDVINHAPWWKKHTRTLPVFKQIYQIHHGIHFPLLTKYWWVGVITQLIVISLMIGILILS